jgi:hypothetical protein
VDADDQRHELTHTWQYQSPPFRVYGGQELVVGFYVPDQDVAIEEITLVYEAIVLDDDGTQEPITKRCVDCRKDITIIVFDQDAVVAGKLTVTAHCNGPCKFPSPVESDGARTPGRYAATGRPFVEPFVVSSWVEDDSEKAAHSWIRWDGALIN